MGMNLKQWGLAREGDYQLSRIGQLVFTKEEAEKLRDKWNKLFPDNPILVVNLRAE